MKNQNIETQLGEINTRLSRIDFPNQAACQRLIGALCMEWSDEWITGRRYLNRTDLK